MSICDPKYRGSLTEIFGFVLCYVSYKCLCFWEKIDKEKREKSQQPNQHTNNRKSLLQNLVLGLLKVVGDKRERSILKRYDERQ